MIRHAIPYTEIRSTDPCPTMPCGGIAPHPECPDHGNRASPAMEWHRAEDCRRIVARKRLRCGRGHFLPADASLPAGPENWDDICRCRPRQTADSPF